MQAKQVRGKSTPVTTYTTEINAKKGTKDNNQYQKVEPQQTRRLNITSTILRTPLVVKGKQPGMNYRKPKLPRALLVACQKVYGTVVDFYRQDRLVNFLHQYSEVSTLVYGGGPDTLMKNAMNMLKNISPDAYSKGGYTGDNFRFRCIHLPANNVG